MIRQIKKIAQFGVYSDFTWNSQKCFRELIKTYEEKIKRVIDKS